MSTPHTPLVSAAGPNPNGQFIPHISSNTTFTPHPKIKFPRFFGDDPKGWVLKTEQYFDFINVDDSRKVKLAVMHFEGKANTWYIYYHTSKPQVPWHVFQNDVILRFENLEQHDIQDQFNKLKQTATLVEYED